MTNDKSPNELRREWYREQADHYGFIVADELNDPWMREEYVYNYARLAGHFGNLVIEAQKCPYTEDEHCECYYETSDPCCYCGQNH